MAKQIEISKLTAQQAHDAMIASGWHPLVSVRYAMHWCRDERAAVIGHERLVDSEPLESNRVTSARFVRFVQLDSGEILAI